MPTTYPTHRTAHKGPAQRPAPPTAEQLKPAAGTYDVLREIERQTKPMTPPKLAAILGVSGKLVAGLCKKGDIPSYQIPGSSRYYINPADYAKHFRLHNRCFAGAR